MQTQDIMDKEDKEKDIAEMYEYIYQLVLVVKLSDSIFIDVYKLPSLFIDSSPFAMGALRTVMLEHNVLNHGAIPAMKSSATLQINFKDKVLSRTTVTTFARLKNILEQAIVKQVYWKRGYNEQR